MQRGKNIIQNPTIPTYPLFPFLLVTECCFNLLGSLSEWLGVGGLLEAPTYASHMHKPDGSMNVHVPGRGHCQDPLAFHLVSLFSNYLWSKLYDLVCLTDRWMLMGGCGAHLPLLRLCCNLAEKSGPPQPISLERWNSGTADSCSLPCTILS